MNYFETGYDAKWTGRIAVISVEKIGPSRSISVRNIVDLGMANEVDLARVNGRAGPPLNPNGRRLRTSGFSLAGKGPGISR